LKDAPVAVKNYLAANSKGWLADLFSITLLDGTVHRWTSCDRDIVIGGNTYLSNKAVLRRSNVKITVGGIDDLGVDLSAVVSISGKSIGLMAAQGSFFGARLQLDRIVGAFPGDLSLGRIMAWFEGRIAGVSVSDNTVRVTVESELGALDRLMLPRFVYQPGCPHALYDPNCAVNKASFTDTGTASGTLTTLQVQSTTAAIIAKAAGYYALGVLKFTSGTASLINVRRAVRSFSVSGGVATFTLALPLPTAPAASDGFSVYAGCDRQQTTCVNKFATLPTFRGFPHVPVSEGAT
jgi:uncharacterized phage protein (TIGR02218 family)